MQNYSINDKENAIRILDYWFLMEFLNQKDIGPFKEKGEKTTTYKRYLNSGKIKNPAKVVEDFIQFKLGDNLQSITKKASDETRLPLWSDFTVFIGCMKREICVRKIAQKFDWNSQNPNKKENHERITLATIKFSKEGIYISNSLAISPLAWAMKKLSGDTSDASQKVSLIGYYSDIKTIEERVEILFKLNDDENREPQMEDSLKASKLVSYEVLKNVENIITEELGIKASDIQSFLAVYLRLYASENDIEDDETEVGLHRDYYSEDLAFVAEGLRNNEFTQEKEKILIDYILGLNRYGIGSENAPNRFDIIKPRNEEELYHFMSDNLSVANAPIGKWPSKFMPALMQQIAINIATSEDVHLPVFSVNGPPGTGKTTLLKEIIVSNIVEKARLLAVWEDPDLAFDDYSFKFGEGQGNSYNQYVPQYYRLKDCKINACSVLVVSSNNTAVENITKELPIEEKIIEDLRPSKEAEGPNDTVLAELTELFTVSKSAGRLPFIQKKWEEHVDENGEKKKRCIEIVEDQPDIYFSRLATELLNAEADNNIHQAFGLISAALGKKSNIEKVETKVIKPLLDIMQKNDDIKQRKQNYLGARKRFLSQLELVLQLRIKLDELHVKEKKVVESRKKVEEINRQIEAHREKQLSQLPEIDNDLQRLEECMRRLNAEKDKIEKDITSTQAISKDLEARIKAQQSIIAFAQSEIETLPGSVSLLERLFKTAKYKEMLKRVDQAHKTIMLCQKEVETLDKSLNEEKQKEEYEQNELNSICGKINNCDRKLNELCIVRNKIVTEEKRLKNELTIAQKETDEQKKQFAADKERYQNQDSYNRGFVLDHYFISDILSPDRDISTKAQITNPWISEHYNREREKLFLYALQMTKEFILGSRKCRDNFKHLDCLWSGSYSSGEKIKFIGDDLSECTEAAYETLFLLIPVISSTFASVQKLFKYIKKENVVGTLVVDEAGQASPHVAMGALCRARRAIIVGDPKQVEPVVTDEQDLLKQTYKDELYKPYADKTNSVQRFADIMNPYGTYLKNADGVEEWVGCPLLVHRRCISPMYEISNDISYSNIMKQQSTQPGAEKQKTFIAEKSQWFNVNGKEEGVKKHFVKEQGEKVIKMLEIAFSKNPTPDVFIITPFTTVESGFKDYVKKYIHDCKRDNIENALVKHESALPEWMEKNVGTVHTFQGKEAAEVIFLLGCDTSDDAKSAIRWVNNNIVNVAATRAKYRFYVIGDIEAWKKSKCVSRAKKILDSYVAGSLGWVPKNYNSDDGYTLVITEKRSVAEAYAKALCVWNESPTNDFYEGNGYLISWCLGHLFELATPEQYDAKYKKWNINDLPIIPDDWKYIKKPRDSKEGEDPRHRFDVLKTLLNREDVTSILCATDAGREGELIFRLVYQQAECKKPFKRIWLSSMEPNSIREAFENPHPATDYDSLYEAANCRQLADWLVGINATRYYSLLHGEHGKSLNVGRVLSPTMAMIVDRENEIESFVPEIYHTVNLNVGGVVFESRRLGIEEVIQVEQNLCKKPSKS